MPATEAPAKPSAHEPSAKEAFTQALQGGYQLKAAGKMTVDDPAPEAPPARTASPAPTAEPAPAPGEATPSTPTSPGVAAKPGPVAAKPSPTAADAEAKRTATAQQWKEVNEDRARLRKQIEDYEAEKAKWAEAGKATEELPSLKAKLTEYDTILRQVAAERHPELIGPINAKIQQALKIACANVPKEQADAVARLLTMPSSEQRDSDLEQVVESLGTVRRARLIGAIGQIEQAQQERQALAERSEQVLTQHQAALQKRHQDNLVLFDQEAADWTDPKGGIELLLEKPGDPEHNARREQILANAKALYSGQVTSPRDLARAAIWSSFGATLSQQNAALLKQVAELTAEITKIKGGGPGLENGGGAGSQSPDSGDEKPKDMTTAQWIASQAQKAGVQFGGNRY